jgi:hypothetical protein
MCITLRNIDMPYLVADATGTAPETECFWFSGPFCHRVLLTLEGKRIPYTKEYIDFNNKPQWCAAQQLSGDFTVAVQQQHLPTQPLTRQLPA